MSNKPARHRVSPEDASIIRPKKICFVVMPFSGPVMDSYFEEAIKPTVEELDYACIRVDKEHYSDKISERIRNNIKESTVVIVDLTEDRPNCYFEAGYAVALGKRIIFQRLHAPPKYEAIFHFDVHDYPFILYRTIADLRKQLKDRLKTLLGKS